MMPILDAAALAKMRAVAARTPQINWICGYSEGDDYDTSGQVVQADKPWMRVAFPASDGDPAIMEHIATFDPPTVLSLLDALEEARAKATPTVLVEAQAEGMTPPALSDAERETIRKIGAEIMSEHKERLKQL